MGFWRKFCAVLAVLTLCLLTACQEEPHKPALLTELTVEAGGQELEAAAFRINGEDSMPEWVTGVTLEQMKVPGSYPVVLRCGEWEYEAVVHVKDTVAPVASAVNVTSLGERPAAEAFVTDVVDVTEVTVRYEAEPDMMKNGEQTVTVVLTDTSGNETRLTAVLTLDLDLEPPKIEGVQDLVVDQGSSVAYRSGITVTDNRDAAPVLSVDAAQVDLSSPGEYTVIYRATDAAGNVTEVPAKVTVRAMKENYVSMETVHAGVADLLEQIIRDDMSLRDQAYAVQAWFWGNARYVNYSDKSDFYQAAYQMLTTNRGDCYNYYALYKLMLERLGIPTLDVRKVKNFPEDSDHYWLMASLDGGESWYHCDVAPRTDPGGPYVYIFMFTDAQLDAYSEAHGGCYNRDKTLYPATPEEPYEE